MWYLADLQGRKKHYLVPSNPCVVGRKHVGLVLNDDPTISRKHAEINVGVSSTSADEYIATITDKDSKYGVFISTSTGDWEKLKSLEVRVLKSGDTIRFGLKLHIWRLKMEATITTTSNLKEHLKTDLKTNLRLLGAQMKNHWREDCTHLTMSQITLTVKAVCAMASGSPIVTPDYWQRYYKNIVENKAPPNYKDYIPPVAEVVINSAEVSFGVVEKRKNMFAGKLFVFPTKARLKELAPMVIAAGGSAVDLRSSNLTLQQLVQPHVIVISYFFNSTEEPTCAEYNNAEKHLIENGRRVVPESEIGLAVLYCSMVKFCNPLHDFTNSVLARRPSTLYPTSVLDLTSQVLAYDTLEIQDRAQSTLHRTQTVDIPESETIASEATAFDLFDRQPCISPMKKKEGVGDDEFINVKNNIKRKRKTDQIDQHIFKKPNIVLQASGVDASLQYKSSTKKLLHARDDDDDSFEFPLSKKYKCLKPTQTTAADESFDFPQLTKPHHVNKTTKPCRTDSEDFEFSTTSTRPKPCLDDDEDMFADEDGSGVQTEEMPIPCNNSQDSQICFKRKLLTSEVAGPPAKRSLLSSTTMPGSTSVSLHGFVNATDSKKECEVDHLADTVLDLVLIEEIPLVMQRSRTPTAQITIGITERPRGSTNFKKFRKVQHPNKTILPRIIGGRDLSVHFDVKNDGWGKSVIDKENNSDDDILQDRWDFPEKVPQRLARK